MNIHAGTGSRTRARTCCRRRATRCPRRARRATSGRPAWCRTPAATPRPARWPCWRCCAARSSRTDGIIIDAASGTTGAGRKASEDFSFSEVDGDFRAYRVLRHQHTPEIERALALAGQPPLKVTFTPHLLPTRRGILATVYGRLNPGKTGRGRGGGDRSLRRGQAVPARRQAGGGPPAPGGRHEPRAARRRRRSRARRRAGASPPSTTWSRGRPDRPSRTPT